MSDVGTKIEKFARNERPTCEACSREMWLQSIKPADLGLELREYECSRCGAIKTLLVKPPWETGAAAG